MVDRIATKETAEKVAANRAEKLPRPKTMLPLNHNAGIGMLGGDAIITAVNSVGAHILGTQLTTLSKKIDQEGHRANVCSLRWSDLSCQTMPAFVSEGVDSRP